MKTAKTLVEHVRAGTFRPVRHGRLLAGEDLPVKPLHPDPSPAMSRLWSHLRQVQTEYRDARSVDVRHDLALGFSQSATAYLDAVERSRRDPLKDLDGLREIVAVNRYARRVYPAEQDQGRDLADDERAAVLWDVRRELRSSRRAR
jgi:hypothetical protein